MRASPIEKLLPQLGHWLRIWAVSVGVSASRPVGLSSRHTEGSQQTMRAYERGSVDWKTSRTLSPNTVGVAAISHGQQGKKDTQ